VSAPVKTQFGWHLVLVHDKVTRQQPLSAVEKDVKQGLSKEIVQAYFEEIKSNATIVDAQPEDGKDAKSKAKSKGKSKGKGKPKLRIGKGKGKGLQIKKSRRPRARRARRPRARRPRARRARRPRSDLWAPLGVDPRRLIWLRGRCGSGICSRRLECSGHPPGPTPLHASRRGPQGRAGSSRGRGSAVQRKCRFR
jgi:hypothetical protein